MAWIKLTNAKTRKAAYYNTDNLVEISGLDTGGTRLSAIAAAGNPISIDTMNYDVAEPIDEVMRRIDGAGQPVVG